MKQQLARRQETIKKLGFLQTNATKKLAQEVIRRKISVCFWESVWRERERGRQQQQNQQAQNEKTTLTSFKVENPAEKPPSPSLAPLSITINIHDNVTTPTSFSLCPNCGFSPRRATIMAAMRAQTQQVLANMTRLVRARNRREECRRESHQRILYQNRVTPEESIKLEKTLGLRKPEMPCIYTVSGLDFICLRG